MDGNIYDNPVPGPSSKVVGQFGDELDSFGQSELLGGPVLGHLNGVHPAKVEPTVTEKLAQNVPQIGQLLETDAHSNLVGHSLSSCPRLFYLEQNDEALLGHATSTTDLLLVSGQGDKFYTHRALTGAACRCE